MFKNCVFKVSVDTLEWCKATAVRAIKTMAETAAGMIIAGSTMSEVDWMYVGSVSLVSGILSVTISIAGIPEVPSKKIGGY